MLPRLLSLWFERAQIMCVHAAIVWCIERQIQPQNVWEGRSDVGLVITRKAEYSLTPATLWSHWSLFACASPHEAPRRGWSLSIHKWWQHVHTQSGPSQIIEIKVWAASVTADVFRILCNFFVAFSSNCWHSRSLGVKESRFLQMIINKVSYHFLACESCCSLCRFSSGISDWRWDSCCSLWCFSLSVSDWRMTEWRWESCCFFLGVSDWRLTEWHWESFCSLLNVSERRFRDFCQESSWSIAFSHQHLENAIWEPEPSVAF